MQAHSGIGGDHDVEFRRSGGRQLDTVRQLTEDAGEALRGANDSAAAFADAELARKGRSGVPGGARRRRFAPLPRRPPRALAFAAWNSRRPLSHMNHVALEVGDLEAALALYGRLFAFELRGREPRCIRATNRRHGGADAASRQRAPFWLVVDDVAAVRAAVEREGLTIIHPRRPRLDFAESLGNHFQIVAYDAVQFERTAGVKRKLAIDALAVAGPRGTRSPNAGSTEKPRPQAAGCAHRSGRRQLSACATCEQRALPERPRDELKARRDPPRRAEANREQSPGQQVTLMREFGAHPLDVGAHLHAVDLGRVLLDREGLDLRDGTGRVES